MSPAVSRAAAVALLGAALLAGWAVAVAPYRSFLAAQEAGLDAGRERLARLSRIADAVPALTRALEGSAAAGDVASPYLDGASDALAGAALHTRLGRLAEGAGLAVTSVEPVAADGAAPGKVALGLAATGSLEGVRRFLHAVESQRPLLFVEELDVLNTSVAEPRFDAAGQVLVLLRLRVAGQRRPS